MLVPSHFPGLHALRRPLKHLPHALARFRRALDIRPRSNRPSDLLAPRDTDRGPAAPTQPLNRVLVRPQVLFAADQEPGDGAASELLELGIPLAHEVVERAWVVDREA